MQLHSSSFQDGQRIPGEYAFALIDAPVKLSQNRNPHLAWSDAPADTQSFALVCHDPDVPSRGDDVNQPDRTVSASLPRVDFYHWLLVDIPPTMNEIAASEFSKAVTLRGKSGPQAIHNTRQGINDYTAWFAGDRDMGGDYYGYDGPCPPWNDEIPHHYVFTLYALDIPQLSLPKGFKGADLLKAMEGHILAKASLTGVYSLNPAVKG